jgi:hypothetical protein
MAAMLGLSVFSGWRARSSRTPPAMLSHPHTGAVVSAVGVMIFGNSAASLLGGKPGEYQWIGTALGVFAGL